jgi:hypothetical protein
MGRFELSEQWTAWGDIDGIFCAASAAIDFGPLDPFVCEVVFNEEFDPVAVDTLEQAWEDLHRNPNVMSMDITLSQIGEDAARVTLSYGGRRLRLSAGGSDWARAKAAYDAAQGVLASRRTIAVDDKPVGLDTRDSQRRITEYRVPLFDPVNVTPPPPRYQPAEDADGEAQAPQYSDDDPPTWKDYLKAAAQARKMLKGLKP